MATASSNLEHIGYDASARGRKWALVLVMIYLSIEFIRPQYYVPAVGIIRPALLTSILLIIVWINTFGLKIARDPIIAKTLIFLGLSVFMIPIAANNYWALTRSRELGNFVLCATIPLAILLANKKTRDWFFDFWLAIHAYVAVFAITHNGRGPGSFLADENDLALVLGMCFPYAILLSQKPDNSRVRKYLCLGVGVLCAAGVVVSNSRGGFVGFVALILYLLWHSKRKFRNLAILAVAGSVTFLIVPSEYKEEVYSISDQQDGTRGIRILMWRIGWHMFLDNPVLGVGPGNYALRTGEYQVQLDDYEVGDKIETRVAHSVYFELIPEYGLVGSTVFFLLVFELFRRLRARDPPTIDDDYLTTLAIRASLVMYLSAGAFLSVLFYPHFWFVVGFTAAVRPYHPATSAANLPRETYEANRSGV